MIEIFVGTFMMGDQNGDPEEYFERLMCMCTFRIDRIEVSN